MGDRRVARARAAARPDRRLARRRRSPTAAWRPGDRLPPERELAGQFGVNRLTVRQALADLQLRRLIRRRTGRNGGTFVADPVIDYDLTTFAGFTAQARRAGRVASRDGAVGARARRRRRHSRGPPARPGRAGRRRRPPAPGRRRAGPGRALGLPGARFAGLLDQPLTGSLYDLLAERYGARPTRAVEQVEPVAADASTARLLGVPRGRPLLAVTRVAFDAAGPAGGVRPRRPARRPRARRDVELRAPAGHRPGSVKLT